MGRYVLVHHGDQEYVLPESTLPNEARLHDALEAYPELFPAEDLNLGQLLVVGREIPLASGWADLIYVEESGQVVIVEVKKGTENADSRRVVAQMLDYGAHLWGMPFEDFEARIALPYLRRRLGDRAPTSLSEAAAQQFASEAEQPGGDADPSGRFRDALAANLAAGTFTYVVIARTLPPTLGTVLDYLASVSRLQTAAVTVDYFLDGDRDIMAPRLAYVSQARPQSQPRPQAAAKTTEERFLDEVGAAAPFWRSFLDLLASLPGRIYWGTRGFSYRVSIQGRQYSVISGYPRTAGWLRDARHDGLELLVEANPSQPASLRAAVASIEPQVRQMAGARYRRSGDNLSAYVPFDVMDANPPEWLDGFRDALVRMFATLDQA